MANHVLETAVLSMISPCVSATALLPAGNSAPEAAVPTGSWVCSPGPGRVSSLRGPALVTRRGGVRPGREGRPARGGVDLRRGPARGGVRPGGGVCRGLGGVVGRGGVVRLSGISM